MNAVAAYTFEDVQADIAGGLSDVEVVAKLCVAYAGQITTEQAFKGVATERRKFEAARATEPVTTPAPAYGTFATIALPMAARGIVVTPVLGKKAFLPNFPETATTDEAQILAWDQEYPGRNAACIARAHLGGFWFMELDAQNVTERIKAETGHDLLNEVNTFMVRSRPGRGHLYFKQSTASIAMGNMQQAQMKHADWSARVDDMYVVAPGSIHPDTGQPYTILNDAPIVEAPEWLIAWMLEQKISGRPGVKKEVERNERNLIPHGSIHGYMLSEAGKLRNMGLDADEIYPALSALVHKNCEPPIDENKVKAMAKSICNFPEGKPPLILDAKNTLATQMLAGVEETEAEAPDTDVVDSKFVLPESMILASSVLSDIYFDVFAEKGWPLELAFPALVTAASVLVPAHSSSGSAMGLVQPPMTSLYTALIGSVNCGKSQVTEWAVKVLGLYRDIRGPHYAPFKTGSAEQMWKYLNKHTQELFPNENEGGVLINFDEWSFLMSKANIPDASFSPTLTSAFYQRKHVITLGGQGGGKDLLINFPFSMIGGVVEEEFDQVFGAGTIGGLYDRTLFGRAPENFKWDYQAFPVEALGKYRIKPVPVTVDPGVYEITKSWNKRDRSLGRIVEMCSRVATILASIDGRSVVTGEDLEALEPLARYQQAIRSVFHPNPGVNPDAISANTILNWVKAHAQTWRTIRDLHRGTNASRKKLGPGVVYRSLRGLAYDGAVEIWYSTVDGGGVLNPLPSDYRGRRPKLNSGLVRLGPNAF